MGTQMLVRDGKWTYLLVRDRSSGLVMLLKVCLLGVLFLFTLWWMTVFYLHPIIAHSMMHKCPLPVF